MIQLDLSILNQKGTPMFNSDIFANRPAAGIAGRIFISTDTLTIYRDTGTTWDTIGGGGGGTIGGTIATGQVAYGTALNTIGGSNRALLATTGVASLTLNATGALQGNFILINNSSGTNYIGTDGSGGFGFGDGNIALNTFTAGRSVVIGTQSIPYFRVSTGTGNVLIQNGGTFTDAGYRVQVIGETLLKGTGSTFATNSLSIVNSLNNFLFVVQNDGVLAVTSFRAMTPSSNIGYFLTGSSAIAIGGTNSTNFQNTDTILITRPYSPTSSSFEHNYFNINATINQTGSANGITRAAYIAPILTSAPNWRSIEWTNNTGWALYGSGTAPSYFAGNVQIGSTTSFASDIKLQVSGRGQFNDTRTYTTGAAITFAIVKDITINSAISGGTGICNYVSTGNTIIQSSRTIPATTALANIYPYNKFQFSSAGLTLTMQQSTPGLRTANQLYVQNVFGGTNNGTITHVAGIHISGFYNEAFSTITPIIPNAFQLVINDTGEFGHPFTFTNRWGIYQVGINDRNYLAGNLLLNSTTDTGQILQVNGAIRVNGQSSGTAGGASGQHLIINVDGTQYKIALLNP